MKLRNLLAIACLIVTVLSLPSCETPEDLIVGKWKQQTKDTGTCTLDFTSTGKYTFTAERNYMSAGQTMFMSSYKVSGDKLEITTLQQITGRPFPNEIVSYKIALTKNELIISDASPNYVLSILPGKYTRME